MAKKVLIKDPTGEEKEVEINAPSSYMTWVGRDITGSKKGMLVKASSREELKKKVAELSKKEVKK